MAFKSKKNDELNARMLTQLSSSISMRIGRKVELKSIMDYDGYRPSLDSYAQEDFISSRARGSVALMGDGSILLPKDVEKLSKDNETFFSE